ncbi:hypothetical protein BCR39DRAFT_590283 [Naematelia encephala]|uniref:Uncharacterized protein n=1 Tax=Naematelia encephala TaxID=71784 RepID=A0A1Y2AS91_9TREE|nr:hypothetical protein BCR39DRAFT_590283 [Naematelia encephala]
MLVLPARSKRPRSPSPDLAEQLSSPLDILHKRRRREEYWSDPLLPPQALYEPEYVDAESSSAAWTRASVNGRRSRQWQYLNAPQTHSSHSHAAEPSSPIPMPRAASQPDPSSRRGQMSSSPIRHHPPSSSPFKSSETRIDDWIGLEEMEREWGAEYTAQNSLLHNLHRARVGHSNMEPSILNSVLPNTPALPTAEQYRTQAPSSISTHSTHFDTHLTPYRYTAAFPSSGPTPYRPGHFPSSPLARDHGIDGMDQDESMDMDDEADGGQAEEEVRKTYEETNRLLAELEVVRRTRWGGNGAENL